MVIKEEGYHCRQDIAKFFRRHNIIEYKGPEDYFSINDFYKVLGYACIYQADTKRILEIRPSEITITIVCNRYPEGLMRHLRYSHAIEAEKICQGIYYIERGIIFPVQIVVGRKLPPDRYIWLSRMRSGLDVQRDIEVLSEAYKRKRTDPLYQAVMDIIMRANQEKYEEAKNMCNALRELFADEYAEKEKEAIERGMRKGIQEGIQQGIRALIEVCQSLNVTREGTMDKVLQKFPESSGMLTEYMQTYWK